MESFCQNFLSKANQKPKKAWIVFDLAFSVISY